MDSELQKELLRIYQEYEDTATREGGNPLFRAKLDASHLATPYALWCRILAEKGKICKNPLKMDFELLKFYRSQFPDSKNPIQTLVKFLQSEQFQKATETEPKKSKRKSQKINSIRLKQKNQIS